MIQLFTLMIRVDASLPPPMLMHVDSAFAYSGDTNTISTITAKAGMGTALEDSGNVVTVEKGAENKTTVTDGDIQQSFIFDNCGRLTNCELRAKPRTSPAVPLLSTPVFMDST